MAVVIGGFHLKGAWEVHPQAVIFGLVFHDSLDIDPFQPGGQLDPTGEFNFNLLIGPVLAIASLAARCG